MTPTAHDHERLLLSSLMRCGGGLRRKIIDSVRPEMFDKYRGLAQIMWGIAEDGRPDKETVAAEYDGDKLDEVANARAVPKNAGRHAEQVREAHGSRLIQEACLDAEREIEDESFLKVANDLEGRIVNVVSRTQNSGASHVSELTGPVLSEIEEMQGKAVTGIPSGIPRLDDMTKGWQDKDLIIPFGSTSMGKSAFTLRVALHAAKEGHTVAIHSLEMSEEVVIKRLYSMQARVNLRQTTIPNDEMSRLRRAKKTINQLPIHVEDHTPLTPTLYRSRLREIDHRHGLDLAVVDYLQQFQTERGRDKKHHEVADIAEDLKSIAKDMGIPVICPSQTNRGPDRKRRRPRLSDLRGAGEEPADLCIGLYRPSYYGEGRNAAGEATDGIGEVILAKQRNGETGKVECAFVEEFASWEPLDKAKQNGSPF